MPKPFSDRIIDYLQRPDYQPMKARRLARAMSIGEAEYGDFHDAVDALRRIGRVVIGTRNALMLPHAAGQITGTYRGNPRGFGFVVPDEPTAHGDLYIGNGDQKDALTGDKVLCDVVKRGQRDGKMRVGGRVIRVLERGDSRFVGQIVHDNDMWYVRPDGNTLHVPIFIGDPGAKSAVAGDQVVVEITQYPTEASPAQGVIVERLGERGAPGVDLLSIIHQHHLPTEFAEPVLQECRDLVRSFQPEKAALAREDLSEEFILTIDPATARDFDDAISLRRLSPSSKKAKGGKGKSPCWELGVHIADVSAFVEPGSALDREAERRGTSVYLPGHVIPMLPEVLSNGLCSLQEGVPRLTKSVFITYSGTGEVLEARFSNTVIRSNQRLSYEEATDILEGRKNGFSAQVVDSVREMESLARVIQTRRFNAGMLVLTLPAVELVLNPHGEVVDAKPEDTSFSHTVIEMFMVEANEAVARLMKDLDVPCLRRIHPDPEEDSFRAIGRFIRAAELELPKTLNRRSLQRLLASLQDKPEGFAVNLAVLKSMQMAEYSPEMIGHYALASEHYAHFTSPIRRYPDLMLHRLLQLYLDGALPRTKGARRPKTLLKLPALKEAGRRMSFLSRRAEGAERELKTLKVLALLEKDVGETFDGVVTGVTSFGLFVQHPTYLVDGLLRVEDLGDDWWEVDVKRGQVKGERSKKAFTLGTVLDVRIVSVDQSTRQLNLSLSKVAGRTKRKPRAGQPAKAKGRGATQPPTGKTRKRSRRRKP